MNRIFLIGNLGKDAEMKSSEKTPIVTFSLATKEKWNSREGKPEERTEWHRIVAFGNLAETCKTLSKGSSVLVEGKIRSRKYQDKDGKEKFTTEIVASSVQDLSGKEKEPELFDQQGNFNAAEHIPF